MSALSAAQFARLKALFAELSELPMAGRDAALASLDEDAAVIAELTAMLAQTTADGQRFAQPVQSALAQFSAERPVSGSTIGAWTLDEEIGAGGMGRVFRARRSDGHFEQTAAMKLLAGSPSATALRYLARERQILASLAHPNISRLLDGGSTESGQPYFVMEHVEGVPINEYCDQHALSQRARIGLIVDICAAVSFAHQHLVVHCDLKPSNILVTADGRPILLDFGISRQLAAADESLETDGTALTPTAATVTSQAYTPRYASPEQISSSRVGTATDVYSLGLVLAELLSPNSEVDTNALPRDLAEIVAKAAHAETAQRYPGADALAADLKRYLKHEPVHARAPTLGYRSTRWLRRYWPWAAVASAFLLTIVLFSSRMMNERDAALRADRASRAVTEYMVSVFQGADPEMSGQRDLPVSELLNAGRDRLSAQLSDQPAVRAELSGILGSVYQTIGQRNQATELFDEAIAILRQRDDPQRLAEMLHKKAYTDYDREDFVAAEPVAVEALTLREKIQPGTGELVSSLRLLGTIRLYLGKGEEARALLERALVMAKEVFEPDSMELARAHVAMARLHINIDPGTTDAEEQSYAAMRIVAQVHGEDHYLYADATEMLVYGLNNRGAGAQALPLAKELSEKRIALFGEISYQAGYALFAYADLLDVAGRRVEAITLLERCVAIQEQLDGRQALSTSQPLNVLAYAQRGAGLYQSSLANFIEVHALRSSRLPDETMHLSRMLLEIGVGYRLLGQLEQARNYIEPVWMQRRKDAQTDSYDRMKSERAMAALFRLEGQFEQATEALASIDDDVFAESPWRRGYVDLELAKIAALQGDNQAALSLFEAAEHSLIGLGEEHPEAWLMRLHRAEFLASTGEVVQARALSAMIIEHAAPTIAPGGGWDARLAKLR